MALSGIVTLDPRTAPLVLAPLVLELVSGARQDGTLCTGASSLSMLADANATATYAPTSLQPSCSPPKERHKHVAVVFIGQIVRLRSQLIMSRCVAITIVLIASAAQRE